MLIVLNHGILIVNKDLTWVFHKTIKNQIPCCFIPVVSTCLYVDIFLNAIDRGERVQFNFLVSEMKLTRE